MVELLKCLHYAMHPPLSQKELRSTLEAWKDEMNEKWRSILKRMHERIKEQEMRRSAERERRRDEETAERERRWDEEKKSMMADIEALKRSK